MKKLKLLPKIHTTKQRSFERIKDEIHDATKDLDIQIESITLDEHDFVTVQFSGEDEVAVENYLSTLYNQAHEFNEVKVGDIVKGYICSSGKVGFGLFVDIGVKDPYIVDALVPLFTLRKQLTDSAKLPVRKIIELFGLLNNIPLEIKLVEVSVGLKKIEAELSDNQVELFNRWREEGLERLIIIGAYEETITRVLEETEHSHDIINIERLGWMEYVLTCKFNTSAKGLIPILGRRLYKAKFEIFHPAKINAAIKKQIKKDESK